MAAARALGRDDSSALAQAELFGTFLLQVALIGIAVGLGPLRSGRGADLLGLRSIPRARILGWGSLTLAASLVTTAVYGTLTSIFAPSLVPPPLPPDLLGEGLRLPAFASVVIVAPFSEELFFRGFVFAGLTSRFGVKGGAAISAAAFAAAHPSVALLVPVFTSGAIFALVYAKTGTLWPVIFAHTMQNALAFALAL